MKISETLAREIVRDIVAAGLQSGDRLPPESAMVDHYVVSRESLREGLRLLEVQGLITLRRGPGGGPVVGHLDPANLGRSSTLFYHLAGGTYAELFEAWVLAEGLMAERAARNPDRSAVKRAMEPYLVEHDADDHSSLEEFVGGHMCFHGHLSGLVGNRVLEVSLQAIAQIVSHHVVAHVDPRQMQDMIEHDHLAIARAVSAGHAHKAAAAMRLHIQKMTDYCAKQLPRQMDGLIDWR
ncbi:MAG TPA: FCD domain-containing protein [Ilumatobacter sp.]|nr:FCD domain-containing protein [Ilumatobacter sp.]